VQSSAVTASHILVALDNEQEQSLFHIVIFAISGLFSM
jgi:hypothetical protein